MSRSLRNDSHELSTYGDTSIHTEDASCDNELIKDIALRRPGYLSSVYIMSYILIGISVTLVASAIIVLVLTYRQAGGESLSSVESLRLASGSCDSSVHTYNIVAHLFINLLGTVILGSSNYIQQVCTSPSITEIARQIRQRGDVSFGANSPSALLRQRSTTLKLLWLSLVFTSLPIHIMLNGIIGYAIFAVDDVGSRAVEASAVSSNDYGTNWTNISSSTCVTYLLNSNIVTDYNNITIVVKNDDEFDYYNESQYKGPLSSYMYWPNAADLENCYINFVTSECQLTIRWFPLVCTTTAVILKSLIVFIALHRHPHFRKRVFNSLGDMIALGARHPHLREHYHRNNRTFPGFCRQQRIRWVHALGPLDLMVVIFWWVSALGVSAFGVFFWVHLGLQVSVGNRLKVFGLGTVSAETSFLVGPPADDFNLGGPSSMFPLLVIIGNSPQLWLSFGYLLWNNQVTRIWIEREWRAYYQKCHIPRVSYDTDEVGFRPTRWLQLPYWLTGSLMVISTLMHWLVSQTLFVVEILAQGNNHFYYLNFSPLAIILIGVVATVLVVAITVYYYIPVRTWMPFMAGSARVVFGSCTRLSSKLPVHGLAWGDVSTPTERLAGFGETVRPLVMGVTYPGLLADEPELRDNSEFTLRADWDIQPLMRRF
jgi:hypothetical protein